jgi:hypothetical protein
VIRRHEQGIPFLAPAIQLLYKSRAARARDHADFDLIAPQLGPRDRAWLRDALARTDPENAGALRSRLPRSACIASSKSPARRHPHGGRIDFFSPCAIQGFDMDTTTPVEAVSRTTDSAQLAALEQQLAACNKQLQVDQAATGKNAATVATLSLIAAQIAVVEAEIAHLNATMAAAAPPSSTSSAAHSATLGNALDVNA